MGCVFRLWDVCLDLCFVFCVASLYFPCVQAVEYVSFASQLTSAEMKKACASALDAAMVK